MLLILRFDQNGPVISQHKTMEAYMKSILLKSVNPFVPMLNSDTKIFWCMNMNWMCSQSYVFQWIFCWLDTAVIHHFNEISWRDALTNVYTSAFITQPGYDWILMPGSIRDAYTWWCTVRNKWWSCKMPCFLIPD